VAHDWDSSTEAEYRILEEDLARALPGYADFAPGELEDLALERAPDASADERVAVLADEAMIRFLMRESFAGTLYPTGFDAEKQEYRAHSALVSKLGAERRLALMRRAALVAEQYPIQASFDAQVSWPGALVDSGETP
jgi:hypothetical protein